MTLPPVLDYEELQQRTSELERRLEERTSQIARAKREWEATFDAIEEPIAVQFGFALRRANVAYAAAAGLPVQQVVGRHCYELLAGRSEPCEACPLTRPDQRGRAEVLGRNGRIFHVSAFRLGEPAGWVLHYEDVTDQRRLERRMRETERLASLGKLASGAAHEINNPLAFLTSNLQSLRELVEEAGIPHDAAEEGLAMIDESLLGAQRVAEIVRALGALSGRQVSDAPDAEVDTAVRRAVTVEFADDKGRVELDLGATGHAAIDPLQLDQLLRHLLRNARQATTRTQRVRVRTRRRAAEVVIEVEDEGAGIATEHRHRVFDPFFTTRNVGGGAGLGLTAAWAIVERHRGSIEMCSEVGRGTTFTVRLPADGRPRFSD